LRFSLFTDGRAGCPVFGAIDFSGGLAAGASITTEMPAVGLRVSDR
jgi:hypothetical protein